MLKEKYEYYNQKARWYTKDGGRNTASDEVKVNEAAKKMARKITLKSEYTNPLLDVKEEDNENM